MIQLTTLTATTIFASIFTFLFTLSSSFQHKISLSFTPSSINKSGDPITIRWSGIQSPSMLDWVGIYSPPDSTDYNFIGYLFLSSSPGWESGSGSITIPLINLRSGYQFRIFHWTESEVDLNRLDHDKNPLPGTNHLLAVSGVLVFESGQGPEQVHLALTGREGEMRVMFVTGDNGESLVKYGLARGNIDRVARTQVSRYERGDMCHAPANGVVGWRDPGFIHDGVMINLEKGKRYYYKVGSDSRGWSKIYTFVSHNEGDKEAIAFLFGDMGTATPYLTYVRTQDESVSTIKWITRDIEALGDKPAFISHIGDISYATGYSWLWDNFFNQIEEIASQVPYHVCIGNHEYNWPLQPWKPDWASKIYGIDGGGECGVPYSVRFNMPGNSSEPTGTHGPATRNLYYSFDMGSVHFVYMSTETNFLPGSKQFDFLKSDLESVDRERTPFVVVQGHRPMYTTSIGDRDEPLTKRMLEHLEPLFVKNKVTVALWAHVHRYERFCPMNNFTCGEEGEVFPVHVVIGMGGQDWQPTWQPRMDHPNDPIFPQPKMSLFRGGEFGYTRLVASKEKLTLSYVGNHDGEVHDMVEIMASGQVISQGSSRRERGRTGGKGESHLVLYVVYVVVLFLVAYTGYFLGVRSHSRRVAGPGWRWIRVRNEL